MDVERFDIEGPLLIRGRRHGDARGFFEETWSAEKLAGAGFDRAFVQDNLSLSAEAGTLRGLHYQAPPAAQGKLVMVLTGKIFDVAVDVREGSPSYGRHLAVELTADEPVKFWVPEGFLHGFVTLTPGTRVFYKVTAPYSAAHDGAIAWDDPDLAIDWPVDAPILSDKDAAAPRLANAAPLFPGTER
ncbi:MAG: dTDP-4-dehydrorhamnose 3,5-epimerase [Oceanicaulis sp.]